MVVGAGPAGLSAAAELSRVGSCLLVEQGRAPGERERGDAREILSGVGGAGLFSDGKHSLYPAASELWALPDRGLLAAAVERAAEPLARRGVGPVTWDIPLAGEPTAGAWHLKRYPSIYVPLARRLELIGELARGVATIWTGARVVSAAREGGLVRLTVERGGARREVVTRAVIAATGRLSPREVRPWLTGLGARFVFRRLEFGIRVEVASDSPLLQRLEGVDPKLRFREDADTEARTFCLCREGEVVLGAAAGLAAFSGRADCPPTGRSNLGLLVRTRDEGLAREVAAALFVARPQVVAMGAADEALRPCFGARGAEAVRRALRRLCELCPALGEDRGALLHMPCIEGVGEYPADDGALRLAPGVYAAGDVCGRFRGIVAGMISGRYAALRSLQRAD